MTNNVLLHLRKIRHNAIKLKEMLYVGIKFGWGKKKENNYN
jgi:hypothetical protein